MQFIASFQRKKDRCEEIYPINVNLVGGMPPRDMGQKKFEISGDLSKKRKKLRGGRIEEIGENGERMGEDKVKIEKRKASEYPYVMQEMRCKFGVCF